MSRTEMLREVRMKRFEEVYDRWRRRRITQALAANVLGVTARTFRRWVVRYEAGGLAAMKDKRVAGPAHRRAPHEEVAALEALCRDGYGGWNVRHFHEEVYVREHGGSRSYTLGEEPPSGGGAGEAGAEEGPAPGAAGAEAGFGDDAAPGRLDARVGWGRAVGSRRDDGRRDGRGALGVLCGGGRDVGRASGGLGRRWRPRGCSTACTRTVSV